MYCFIILSELPHSCDLFVSKQIINIVTLTDNVIQYSVSVQGFCCLSSPEGQMWGLSSSLKSKVGLDLKHRHLATVVLYVL